MCAAGQQDLSDSQAIIAMDSCSQMMAARYDETLGGFGGAPKFPRPSEMNLLLVQHLRAKAAGSKVEAGEASCSLTCLFGCLWMCSLPGNGTLSHIYDRFKAAYANLSMCNRCTAFQVCALDVARAMSICCYAQTRPCSKSVSAYMRMHLRSASSKQVNLTCKLHNHQNVQCQNHF